MKNSPWMIRLLSSALALVLLAGCGGPAAAPTGNVSGAVTFNDQPVANASVELLNPTTGQGASATTDAAGKYSIKNLRADKYGVRVTPLPIMTPPEPGKTPEKPEDRKDIPTKARDAKTSGLTVEVKSGENSGDLKLAE